MTTGCPGTLPRVLTLPVSSSFSLMPWLCYLGPLFRNHGRRGGGPPQDDGGSCGRTGGANEIWEFGNESEAAIARVMAIREQLRPYVMEQ